MGQSFRAPKTPVWPALKTLVRHIGLWRTFRIAWLLRWREKTGEPFGDLPPASDEQEAMSRAQIGPSILLYRELCELLSKEEALRTTEAVVAASGVVFMRRVLGKLDRKTLEGMDDEERRRFVEAKGERFFSATMRWDNVSSTEVRFTVTSCHFPRLCEAVGTPELSELYCKVDAAYFGSVEPNVQLERENTIATGHESCGFRLSFSEKKS